MPPAQPTVLILAGTTEATELASALDAAGVDVISSLAGVTSAPAERAGRVRRGGFGGVAGLHRYLVENRVDLVVDATHPFAARMPHHAARAAGLAGVPACRLIRDPWQATDGDRWIEVDSLDEAAAALAAVGARRVLLTTGRQSVAPFVRCADQWFLVRSIEPLEHEMPNMTAILERGPYDVGRERALMASHRIDTLVSKNSGGSATEAKLTASRELGVNVVMIRRPPQPIGVDTATSVPAAVAWTESTLASLC